MGSKTPKNDGVSRLGRVLACIKHGYTNLAYVSHHRLLAYSLVAIFIALGVGAWDNHQRDKLAATQYRYCVDTQEVKKQANERILLLKGAQRFLAYRDPKDAKVVASIIDSVNPLPIYDCKSDLPHK